MKEERKQERKEEKVIFIEWINNFLGKTPLTFSFSLSGFISVKLDIWHLKKKKRPPKEWDSGLWLITKAKVMWNDLRIHAIYLQVMIFPLQFDQSCIKLQGYIAGVPRIILNSFWCGQFCWNDIQALMLTIKNTDFWSCIHSGIWVSFTEHQRYPEHYLMINW